MANLSLYEINQQIMELVAEIDDAEAVGNDALIEELESTISELFPALDKKRESYVRVIRSSDAHANSLREESRRLARRAKNMENLSTRLKQTLHDDLATKGEVKADAGIFRLSVAQSPPKVQMSVRPEQLPIEFQIVSVSANTALLKKALQDDRNVNGVELVRGTHLRIR